MCYCMRRLLKLLSRSNVPARRKRERWQSLLIRDTELAYQPTYLETPALALEQPHHFYPCLFPSTGSAASSRTLLHSQHTTLACQSSRCRLPHALPIFALNFFSPHIQTSMKGTQVSPWRVEWALSITKPPRSLLGGMKGKRTAGYKLTRPDEFQRINI
jgi:hypothetical protein